MYQYNNKEIKESIFLAEARESQKVLIKVASLNTENTVSPPPPTTVIPDGTIDIDKIRANMGDKLSTATSLESLESRVSDFDKTDAV